MDKFDLAVIGSGPGGYVTAIYAAQCGLKVVCIEKDKSLGGTCLNVGCIPSKALLHSTEYYHRIAETGKKHGIIASELTVDFSKMMGRKQEIVAKLTGGIDFLFKKNKVQRVHAHAKLLAPTLIEAEGQNIEASHIVLATGSEPIALPFLPFDEKRVLSSTGALSLEKIPKKMLIIGAGIIGLELGSVYRRLGAEIEVVELLDRVTPNLDREISTQIYQILKREGFHFHLNTKVAKATVEADTVTLYLPDKTISGDCVLVAVGRRPYSKNLGLKEAGVHCDSLGRVIVDSQFRSSIPHIFAIGDLIDGPMLAHKASEEGMVVVDLICGKSGRVNYMMIPNVMYTWPEVAAIGLTEEEALAAGLEIIIGKVPFKAVPRARCSDDEEGFVKIIGEKKTDRLIGLHIIGPFASEMIHEGVIAMEHRATIEHLARASHAHPTCSEAIKEAALAAHGQAIHL